MTLLRPWLVNHPIKPQLVLTPRHQEVHNFLPFESNGHSDGLKILVDGKRLFELLISSTLKSS